MGIYFGVVIIVMKQQKYLVRIPTQEHWYVCAPARFNQNVTMIGITKDYIGIEYQWKKEQSIGMEELKDETKDR